MFSSGLFYNCMQSQCCYLLNSPFLFSLTFWFMGIIHLIFFVFTNMFSHLEESYIWKWSALADQAECAAIQTDG